MFCAAIMMTSAAIEDRFHTCAPFISTYASIIANRVIINCVLTILICDHKTLQSINFHLSVSRPIVCYLTLFNRFYTYKDFSRERLSLIEY